MVKYIGSINDTITLLENTPSKGLLSFYSSAQALPVTDTLMNNSTGGRTAILSVHREDPTSYSVILQLEGPTVLVLSQAFSDGWTARIGERIVQDHFRINRYANGWLVPGVGKTTVEIEFSGQTLVWYGTGISILSTVSALLILVLIHRKRNSQGKSSPPSLKGPISHFKSNRR